MKTFEISQKKNRKGRRQFKVILHEIYPDSCIDEENKVGTKFNANGITWIKEYCENALESIKGMSLRCEFLDDERTELCGHGMTDIQDDIPIFENAVVIGTFDDGYIEEIETEEGETIIACIGVGTIDASCYHNFCQKLDENIANGIYPNGSVEIMRKDDNEGIVYKYGYVEEGRIPQIFDYSGYALLGITPADEQAKLVELNEHKEDTNTMNETEIKALIEQTVSAYTNQTAEINQCKADCDKEISELNKTVENLTAEKNEAIANSEKIQKALDDLQVEWDELNKKWDALWEEKQALEKALGEARAKERIGELNAAIADYTDEERAFAQAEIDAFNADPIANEVNSVVDKILIGIGKKTKETAVVETNAAKKDDIVDIFSAVETKPAANAEDENIF